MTDRLRLRSAIAWLTASALGGRVLGAATGVISARALGPEGRGTFALLLLAGLVGGAVASGGLDLWAARALASGADPAGVVRILRRHQMSTLAAVGISYALVVALTPSDPVDSAATAALVWFTAGAVLKLGLLQGAERIRAYSWSLLAGSVSYAAAVGIAGAVGADTVTSFVFAAVLGKAVTAGWRFRTQERKEVAGGEVLGHRAALAFGSTTMLGGLVTLALYRLDVAVVAAVGSTSDAGVYSVALAMAEVLWVLPTSAAQAVLPRASTASPTVDTGKVNRVIVAAMVLVAIAVSLAGPLLIPLVFGSEFRDAALALPGLAIGSVAVGSWKLLAHDLLGRGDARTRVTSGVAGVAVMVALDLLLVPGLGIVGASVGSLAGYSAAAAVTVRAWRRRTGASLSDLLVLRRGDVASLIHGRRPTVPMMPADPLWSSE